MINSKKVFQTRKDSKDSLGGAQILKKKKKKKKNGKNILFIFIAAAVPMG